MTRVLVTGGSGFIGKHLVSALVARGREVRVLDVRAPLRADPRVQSVTGSVLDSACVQEALDGVPGNRMDSVEQCKNRDTPRRRAAATTVSVPR